MLRPRTLAVVLALAGLVVLAWAVQQGQASVALVLIFPVLYGTSPLAFLGIALLMLGLFLWFWSGLPRAMPPVSSAPGEADRGSLPGGSEGSPPRGSWSASRSWSTRKSGGILLLGPIPIVWGSDARIAKWMLVLAAVVLLLALAVNFLR